MRFEPPPTRNAIRDFATVSSAKSGRRKTRLERVARFVLDRYCDYYRHRAALETLRARRWSVTGREALIHCYEGSTKDWDAMRTDFLNGLTPNARAICPYCLIREPESWDHFLPKERFPEFSVLLVNLVYVCGACNRKKGARLAGQPRQVLNPYFDAIPEDTALLYAGAAIVGGVPRLRFVVAGAQPGVSAPLAALAQRHFEAFELEAKLISAGGGYLATIVDELVARYGRPISEAMLQAELEIRRGGLRDASVNDWRLALLAGLETCDGLVDYLNARIAARPIAPLRHPPPQRDRAFQQLALRMAAAEV